MKYIFTTIITLSCICSCTLFKYDNYDAPDTTISGAIVDLDGNPLQVENGGGARVRLMDYGFSDNPQEFYLNVKGDGTFINTKIFDSTYEIVAEGPFVPLIQVDENSEIIVDKSLKNMSKGKLENIVFKVEPYLKLEWIDEPVVNENGTVTASFSLTRGTDNEAFHMPVKDVTLFINTVQYVGNGNYDKFCSCRVEGDAAAEMLGKENSLTTIVDEAHILEKGRPYYIRIGARMDNPGVWGGQNYNYTSVKKVIIPK